MPTAVESKILLRFLFEKCKPTAEFEQTLSENGKTRFFCKLPLGCDVQQVLIVHKVKFTTILSIFNLFILENTKMDTSSDGSIGNIKEPYF